MKKAQNGRTTTPSISLALALVLGGLLLGSDAANANCAVRAGNVERNPDADFTNNNDGTVTHKNTKLRWKRCPEGRAFSNGTCTGTTLTFSWQAALRRGVTDTTTGGGSVKWRLPSRAELMSLVETACSTPAINTTMFPSMPSSGQFWTSTHAGPNLPTSAWGLRFSDGVSLVTTKSTKSYVLLVAEGFDPLVDGWRSVDSAPSEPNAFFFASKIGDPGATVDSAIVTIAGLTSGKTISISGGEYRIHNGTSWDAFRSTNGTITNNNQLQVRLVAPNTVPSGTSATVNINGRTATFLVTTGTPPPDSVPDNFTFTDVTGVFPSTLTQSNTITVTGINQLVPITVSGGEYQINGGAWTNAAGNVINGDTVAVRHTSSATYSTTVNTTLTIGTISDTFSTTTGAQDTTPDVFSFVDQTNVARSTTRTSNTITIAGINSSVPVSITGGEYQVGAGVWTSASGNVTNGQTVTVRHTSSASFSTAVNTTLTIGGVSDTFSSTTEAIDTTPNAFAFTDQTGVALSSTITSDTITVGGINSGASISVTGGAYKINSGTYQTASGTVNNGDTVTLQHTSSGTFSTAVNTVLTIGGVSDTFTSTTLAADTTPDAFTFTDQVGVARSSVRTSNAIAVSGINSAASISVTGGTYSINGGAYTSANGTVSNGQTVTVQHTASANYATTTNTTLTIGGVSDTFSSTTESAPGDSTPNAFTFVDQTNVAISTTVTSAAITVTGIDTAASVTITGGEYQINGGAWTSSPGSVTVNQTIAVRHTSSASFNTQTNTVLTIGGVSDTFTSTTVAADTTPNAFTFTDQTGVALSSTITSNAITVAGINTGSPISVTGGTYSINGGAYTSTNGTVSNGDSVTLQHTSSASFSTATNTVLTIGGVSDTFTSTTLAADTTPNAFSFTDVTGVALSSTQTSNSITVAGINTGAPISVTGGTYNINGGAYTSASGTVNNGDQVSVQHVSSGSYSTVVNTALTIGGVSDTFSSTTAAPPCGLSDWIAQPNFTNVTVDKDATCTTAIRSISGLCAGSTYTYTETTAGGNGETNAAMSYSLNGGTSYLTSAISNAAISNGSSLRLRFVGQGRDGSTYTFKFRITDGSNFHEKTWVVTTNNSGTACPATAP